MNNEPIIKKFPTELFGCAYNQTKILAQNLENQHCPYLSSECKKPRKSEPHIKVGVCSVGYKGEFLTKAVPVIVCPHRFQTSYIFETIAELYLSKWKNINWVKEVSIGVGGSVDFVATTSKLGKIQDFLCVEFQAAGTTGTPWQAVLEMKSHQRFLQETYPFGINWANEFSKTMMQQVYKKGKIVSHWKRKIVFVFQDVGLDYLHTTCDTSELRAANDDDPIHFCTFKLVWKVDKWEFQFCENVSTDIAGVNKLLGGVLEEYYPSVEYFVENIEKKLKS